MFIKKYFIDFSGAHFEGEKDKEDIKIIDFSDFHFPIRVNFSGTKFSGKAIFRNTIFDGNHQNISFENAEFEKQSLFTDLNFEKNKG